jgi:hypothetical protein
MPYYPLSQIKTNLYTNGGEYCFNIHDPNNTYSGYYWKTSDGKFFTGKTPQDTPNEQIYTIPPLVLQQQDTIDNTLNIDIVGLVNNTPELIDYLKIKQINPSTITFIPTYYPTQPTQQDYQIGEFRRYFCKKTNEIQYTEISKDQFDLLVAKDPQILWQLYLPFFIPWNITGTKEHVARVNKNIVELTMKNLRLPRFNDYLKNDYTKYYK